MIRALPGHYSVPCAYKDCRLPEHYVGGIAPERRDHEVRASWSLSWHVALTAANWAAYDTGFRYRVRRSWARPERWLVMRAVPVQQVGAQRVG
jgi:hypothetical protein